MSKSENIQTAVAVGLIVGMVYMVFAVVWQFGYWKGYDKAVANRELSDCQFEFGYKSAAETSNHCLEIFAKNK